MSSHQEKRTFKRYKHATAFTLTIAQNSYQAITTDYSLKGIGFFLEKAQPIAAETQVRLTIDDLKIDGEGKIVWTQNVNSQIRGGIEIKFISGLLKHFPLSDMLIDLQRSRKTGLLDIRQGKIIKRVYLSNGDIVYATSNREEDRFIEMLLRKGMITDDQYYQILHIAKQTEKSLGSVIEELEYLKPENLDAGIKSQVEEIVTSLFHWEDGRFAFIEGLQVPDKIPGLGLSTASLIYRGIMSIRNTEPLKKVLLQGNAVMMHSSDPVNLCQDVMLDTAARNIFSLVNGKRHVQEILTLSPDDENTTLRILYALQSMRMLEIAEAEKKSAEDVLNEEVSQETPREEPRFLERVENLYNRLPSIDYYSFLGVEKRATLDTIRKAYYSAVKEFHPDRHLHLSSDTLKNQLNTIFAHLTEVYRVLSNITTRVQYDQGLVINPAPLQTNKVTLARMKFREGQSQFKKGAFDHAKELFEQAIYLDDSVSTYPYYMALALAEDGKYTEAVKMLNQALKIDPFDADYLAELGHIYLHLGYPLRAKSTFEKALQSNPSHKKTIEGLQKIPD
jgi:tetratricopeptide (TPR) repeat protein